MSLRHIARHFLSVALLAAICAAASAQETTPAIKGVVNAGTAIQLVKDGFEAVEGPVHDASGGLLFTNNRMSRIVRVAPDGNVATWYEGKGAPNALSYTTKGELVATLHENLAIGILKPGEAPRVLVGTFEGNAFNRPNDLVADKRGNIYFTDSVSLTATAPPVIPSAVYQITADGKLVRITTEIERPKGIALSPDERTLFVANTAGEWIYAYELDAKGTPGKRREFAKLSLPPPAANAAPSTNSGADGIAVDDKGRIYVATTIGVQVFSAKGEALGNIVLPKQPQNLAFAGKSLSDLYVVGRGAVYRIATQTHGVKRAGK